MKETQKTGLMTKINDYITKFARKHPKLYIASVATLGYGSIGGLIYANHKRIEASKPKQPTFLECIADKKYIQRDGTRVYVDEFWYKVDENTKKKATVIYIDKDNNGFPESSCSIYHDAGGWIREFSNTDMLKEESITYFGKEK